jgi:hypothetical protein
MWQIHRARVTGYSHLAPHTCSECHGLSLAMEVSMQILKMVAYAAGGSVVVGFLLGGVVELVGAVQMHMVQTRKPVAKI